jgi:hypothetical protein
MASERHPGASIHWIHTRLKKKQREGTIDICINDGISGGISFISVVQNCDGIQKVREDLILG